MNTRFLLVLCYSLLLATILWACFSIEQPWNIIASPLVGILSYRLFEAVFTGHPMKEHLLSRNTLLKLRGHYRSNKGTYLLVEYGDKRVQTVFLNSSYPYDLKLGGTYTWDGLILQSAKD
ncbi:MAG: hypothetical protein WC767_01800 [Candidatus Paceibacterota bacterium]|jgi:hypothetical protein